MLRRILAVLLDLSVAALILLAVWIFSYKLPQSGIRAETQAAEIGEGEQTFERTQIRRDTTDWHTKFADKFTDAVVATDTSYTSPDLSVQLSFHQYDTGRIDPSECGKHEKYGTSVSYVLADIYVGDITCFQTAFAQDTYGVGYTEKLSDMSDRMHAVLAVNGDSYSNNRHRENGTIIRNGVVYRCRQADAETCVLNWDGRWISMRPVRSTRNSWRSVARIRAGCSGRVSLMSRERRKLRLSPGIISGSRIRERRSDTMNRGITACFWWMDDSLRQEECSWMRWQRCLRIWDVRQPTIWMAVTALL